MPKTHIHLINHTHWDREWFLTSVYTSQWIPGLIDKLERLAHANPNFRYLFDGQTLVIEDLLALRPDYSAKVQRLIEAGTLLVGPYYCQPDWQLTAGETLIRNLQFGIADTWRLRGELGVGWLVDTFGHISQAPQIHQMFSIDTVFVWRGVPQLTPFFSWCGADGTTLFAIDLFGGYRNLYGVTHAPEVAVRRLTAEVGRLRPYYPEGHIPLFDGYDLEDDPEDPLSFFESGRAVPPHIVLQESTPAAFASAVRHHPNLPQIAGELNSGKYGATFPGTFSARTYLKVMAYDCERLLYQVCEPLAVLARLCGRRYPASQSERWSRALLQNAVHDCICGVSIDQVHEKMEYSYRRMQGEMLTDVQHSLTYILADFAQGDYAVSTNPMPSECWQAAAGQLYHINTDGIGIWPVQAEPLPHINKSVTEFVWSNDHYTARVGSDGRVWFGEAAVGQLVVSAEHGDSYSDETGERLGILTLDGPLTLLTQHADYAELYFYATFAQNETTVTAEVRLIFDRSPLLRWHIDLDSRGTDFKVDLLFETGIKGQIYAAMPFDIVARPTADSDLLPRQVEGELGQILMGQRELNAVHTFPLQDFVACVGGGQTATIFAKGVRSYTASDPGCIALTLRRAVEWVTRADLANRVGDAGPFFYVPDGRCERKVRHEIGFYLGAAAVDSADLLRLNATFHSPPLIVQGGGGGERTAWHFWGAPVPLASMQMRGTQILARVFNPTDTAILLSEPQEATDVWGATTAEATQIGPKEVMTLRLAAMLPPLADVAADAVVLRAGPAWRVGENAGLPDPQQIVALKKKAEQLEAAVAETSAVLEESTGDARLRLKHQLYAQQRERLEYALSARLNEIKLAQKGRLDEAYLYSPHPDVEKLGYALNQLRIKRRIFDYVVGVL